MVKSPLGVAMIGCEFMGRAHANAWRQAPRFFELPRRPVLRVVCARDPAKLARAAEKLGFAEHTTDWRSAVRRSDVDVVDICTPGDSHAEIAIAAAQAGKAVLCEKPLANSVAEAEAMVAAVGAAGVLNLVCHNYRRAPAIALAKRILDEGRLGELRHYRGAYLQDWIVDPAFPRGWRLERARAGSGALGDIGSHQVDLARYLLGEIAEVSGLLHTFVTERPLPGAGGRGRVDVDDAALALLRFETGAIGSLEATRFAAGRKNANCFEINGSRGSLAFDLERLNELELYEEQGALSGFRTLLATDATHPYLEAWWPPGHALGYEHTFVNTVADFVRALARGEPANPSFADGLATQRVLAAIERSSRSRRWESVG